MTNTKRRKRLFQSRHVGKVAYINYGAAMAAAKALEKKRGTLQRMEAYKCIHCQQFHIGHGKLLR